MKKSVILTTLVIAATGMAMAAESLPVLRVSFPASRLNSDNYIQGEMTLEDTDGSTITLPAKMKTRGATALKYTMKPSFNMKLEGEDGVELDTDLLGLRTASSWILDAMAIDRICMRNRVCFDIWNEYSRLPYATDFNGRNGTVGKFVIVYMNDTYKGIYCLTDKINRKLLDLKKPKVDGDKVTIRGVLYKNGTTDIGDQGTVGFYNDYMVYVARWHDAWELKEPDDYPSEAAWQPLVDYYNNYDNNYVLSNFDVDNLLDYSLLIMALSIGDNWGNKNKYFSMKNSIGDEEDQKFVVTPWDLDASLGGNYDGSNYDGNYTDWTMKQIANSASRPFSVCFTANIKERMKARWEELRGTAFSVESVAARMYDYCNLFEESGAWQEYVDYWNNQSSKPRYVENLRAEIDQIVEWYAKRHDSMDEYFGVAAIDDIYMDKIPGRIYNLQGLPVNEDKMIKGAVYIRDGKKFIAR